MRKGFTILEMMTVIIMFPAVAIILDGLFTTILRDIPRSSRIVQENTSVLNLLEHIQDDIDQAKSLPDSSAGQTANEQVLLIELPDGTISYELKDGEILRRSPAKSQEDDQDAATWSVPNGRIRWRVWKKDGIGYAVEIETHIRYKRPKKWEKKMANSHLYFVGAL
ncbi:MAG: type II secretion system protein [Phycisphaerae bacterium]|nr:type II secretion system protein [Phycisphaerae bacterium]